MDGQPYQAARFAATLRRQLYKGNYFLVYLKYCSRPFFLEHLGLITPQICDSRQPEVTSFMRPVPHLNDDQTESREDSLVADPLSKETDSLWKETAKKNREIFTEIFRPVPTNLVRSWTSYEVSHTISMFFNSIYMMLYPDLSTRSQARPCRT
jgi:phospholipase D1/2